MFGTFKLIYDNIIQTTNAIVTSPEYNDELGLYDQLGFHIVADEATSSNTLLVNLQHSADQINWVNEGTSLVASQTVNANAVNYWLATSSDNSTQQGAGYRRLAIQLTSASAVHVRIYAAGHDQSIRVPTKERRALVR